MSPDLSYVIGHEKGVGTNGNGPILLYDFWPVEIALFFPPLLCSFPFIPDIEFSVGGILSLFFVFLDFTIIIGFQLFLRHQFRIPYNNNEFELLVDKARNRMDFTSTPELWLYSSSKPVLIPLSWLFIKVIVL